MMPTYLPEPTNASGQRCSNLGAEYVLEHLSEERLAECQIENIAVANAGHQSLRWHSYACSFASVDFRLKSCLNLLLLPPKEINFHYHAN